VTTVVQVVFGIIAVLILGAGILTVTSRNLVHAALWLIAAFFGVGALYLLMQAEFAAVVQVLVYVGAIAILVLFAIMLTPDIAGEQDVPIFRQRWVALVVAAALFGLLLAPTVYSHPWAIRTPLSSAPPPIAGAREIGTAFMREYLLPFELASVLLLAALVGAVVIGIDPQSQQRVLTLVEAFRLRRSSAPAVPDESPDDAPPEAVADPEAQPSEQPAESQPAPAGDKHPSPNT
jgi:NADH-quinone oxidoreductase subunit J